MPPSLVACHAVSALWLVAAAPAARHRFTSRLVDGFTQWWQMPGLVLLAVGVVVFVLWTYQRDAAELSAMRRLGLVLLRLGAFAALGLAWLDVERITEYEIVSPSRVAVLVDTSASMTLPDGQPDAASESRVPATDSNRVGTVPPEPASGVASAPAGGSISRMQRALDVLDAGGLLASLRGVHEVSLWAFDGRVERCATLPPDGGDAVDAGAAGDPPPEPAPGGPAPDDWRTRLVPQGEETRLGSALAHVLDEEPAGLLAGVVVLSDGASNAGLDPRAAATALAAADVAVHPFGLGADTLPANVRIADLLAPARVFPDDRFAVTAFLQPQGLVGAVVRVELFERAADADGPAAVDAAARAAAGFGRPLDAQDAKLGADGDLLPVTFTVAGLPTPGRRTLLVRVVAPSADRTPRDDVQAVDVEVVDRVTRVLLMASGPGREFQFMRNVLERDRSFAVDTFLATAPAATEGGGLARFPESDAALAEYDALVAFDVDWRQLDPSAQARLERWVGQESGGMVFVAGHVFTERWAADPAQRTVRGLVPVEVRGLLPALGGDAVGDATEPRPVRLTRDGEAAEFLRLAADAAASETLWNAFPGVFSCFAAGSPKPGATVYARLTDAAGPVRDSQPVYLAGHYYGSGTVLYVGSGELWRLRSVDPRLHERLTTQVVRHVAQGRLLRGSRTSRLLVDRERVPVGGTVQVRLVLPDGAGGGAGPVVGRARGPDGDVVRVPLEPEPGRVEVRRGGFVVSTEGTWQVDVDVAAPVAERLSRRVQAHLPDRELVRPRLERSLLTDIADTTGGRARFLATDGWARSDAEAIVAALPDRSRRTYESGGDDTSFKRRLNTWLLAIGVGLLCSEWLARRLLKLA